MNERSDIDGIMITHLDSPTGGSADGTEKERGSMPLRGIRLAVKDNINVTGLPTTQGSQMFGGESALTTAPVVSSLVKAGATVIGKANMHEFAYGTSSNNPWYGPVPNPRYPDRTPGGSSGGSAAALAAGLADLALGTDTAGSIRMPSACCGTVGLRPRNGVLDLSGVAPLSPSFDTVGPMATSVEDVARSWAVMSAGAMYSAPMSHDGTAPLSGTTTLDFSRSRADDTNQSVRVAVYAALQDGVAELLERIGLETVPISLPFEEIESAFWPAFRAEVARTHQETYPRFAERYDPNVAAKLAAAQGIDFTVYRDSMDALRDLRDRVIDELNAAKAVAMIGPILGCELPLASADERDFRDALGQYSVPASALNLAALAIGDLQLIAVSEQTVLALGLELERAGLRAVPPRLE